MSLGPDDFPRFFAAVNGGHPPFAWQTRLAKRLVSTGTWPETIGAPTGSGKSQVVDIHVFANALYAAGVGARVPRRLLVMVDRRALVDKHYARGAHLVQLMKVAEDGVLTEVRELLRSLATSADLRIRGGNPLVTASLRGGQGLDSTWLDDPTACGIVCATPDMGGSRLLMRGYGSRPQAWPREAGLLAYDCALVLDEAHLNRQLLATARRVRGLEERYEQDFGVPRLQVVETTATPLDQNTQDAVGVTADDLFGPDADPVLARRLLATKRVEYVPTPHWPSGKRAPQRYVQFLADEVSALSVGHGRLDGPVACVVNRVDTATRVAEELRRRAAKDGVERVIACWVGRMRPMDLVELQAEHPDIVDADQEPTVDVLVSTQTVEVGVDADFSALVTELASGSALAQRVGRLNRRGRKTTSVVHVVGPEQTMACRDVLPYTGQDLEAAREWVLGLEDVPNGMSPWEIVNRLPPAQAARRMILARPERHDTQRWAMTSLSWFSDETLELWLSDDLGDQDLDAGLVIRASLPEDDASAVALLRAAPVVDDETFPVSLGPLRTVAKRIVTEKRGLPRRVFLIGYDDSGQTISVLRDEDGLRALRPGSVLVVDLGHPVSRERVIVDDPDDEAERLPLWLDQPPSEDGSGRFVRALIRDRRTAGSIDDSPQTIDGIAEWALLDALAGLSPEEAAAEVAELTGKHYQVTLPPDDVQSEAGKLPWVVLVDPHVVRSWEHARQEWTPGRALVTLARHSRAVGERARDLGRSLELPDRLVTILEEAGKLHDLGKADPRFQRMLGAQNASEPLAKGRQHSLQQIRRDRAASGLPAGWRHELRSVIAADEQVADCAGREMILRLVGTSHGHARPEGPTAAETLTVESDDGQLAQRAAEFFREGKWAELLCSTHEEYGVWACAYLEAVLRAADCQISKEGS